jgi:hypothetical protein
MSEPWRARGLTLWDDLPLHQTAGTFRELASAHPQWVDRFYMNIQGTDGSLLAILGFGFFPNTGLIEWYVCALDGSRQRNVRGVGELGERAPKAECNGFRFEIIEPMRVWTVDIDVGGLKLDLTFESVGAPFHFRPIWCAADVAGGEFDDWQHFVQVGKLAGRLDAGTQISVDGMQAVRDRTWGVRSRRPKMHNWYTFDLGEGRMFALLHQERADGSVHVSEAALVEADGQTQALVVVEHRLSFDAATREIRASEWVLRTQGGETATLAIEPVGASIRGLGAGYDERQGQARDLDSSVVGEVWDLADPDVAAKAALSTIDTPVRASLTGALEATGGGVAETALGRSHQRYGRSLERR